MCNCIESSRLLEMVRSVAETISRLPNTPDGSKLACSCIEFNGIRGMLHRGRDHPIGPVTTIS